MSVVWFPDDVQHLMVLYGFITRWITSHRRTRWWSLSSASFEHSTRGALRAFVRKR